MPDYKDWQKIVDRQKDKSVENSSIQYVNVGSEVIWIQMQGWLDEQIAEGKAHLEMALNDLATSGNFAYESLVRHKSLIDIRQAELRIIEQFSEKIRTYHSEEES